MLLIKMSTNVLKSTEELLATSCCVRELVKDTKNSFGMDPSKF